MPCALPKNPIIIGAPSFSIELAKTKFFMTPLMSIRLELYEIENSHIVPPSWEMFHFFYTTNYFAN